MPAAASDLRQVKKDLRKASLARRNALPAEMRIEAALGVAEHGASLQLIEQAKNNEATIIGGYHPIRSELDPRPLMAQLAMQGWRLSLPVVTDDTTIVFRELLRDGELVESGFGTVGPPPEVTEVAPDVLLMPLSVFDERCGRMGYGAGFYDRYIDKAAHGGRKPLLIGLAFETQRVDDVPMEPHDQYLDAIVTENRIIERAEVVR